MARKLVVQGQEYDRPDTDDLTLRELEMMSDMGAEIPTEEGKALSAQWIRGLVMIVKLRAGEKVYPDALLDLKLGDIQFEGDEEAIVPPPNRAARRARKNGN